MSSCFAQPSSVQKMISFKRYKPMLTKTLLYTANHHSQRSLLRQCDEEGLVQNALVPTYHCMHTPGGPLKYSLEGHRFAVFSIKLTTDFRYVVSVSNKFITWDVHTSDLARTVEPKGIYFKLSLFIHPENHPPNHTSAFPKC